MPLPNVLFVNSPAEKGRRYAISDIHGCELTFKAILKQIRLKKKDQLFLIGDMVNRGPSSHKVLDHIIQLKSEGFQVYFIRGNHEQAVLNTVKKTQAQRKRSLKGNNSLNLLEKGEIKQAYLKLLKESYHYIELDDYFLVHAGFNHKVSNPFEDTFSMLNIRKFKTKSKFLKDKKLVIGHTPKNISTIVRRVKKGKRKLFIDNGCANYKTREQGNMLCLDLDTRTLIVQINLDC